MKFAYYEFPDVKNSISSERLNSVSQFKMISSTISNLQENPNLSGESWDSTQQHLEGYKVIDNAIFNIFYEMETALDTFLVDFLNDVGETENLLDTDNLAYLLRELQTAQNAYNQLMQHLAKSMKDVPILGNFFHQESMQPLLDNIDILEDYIEFEGSHSGHFSDITTSIQSLLNGLSFMGNPQNFLGGSQGYKKVDLNQQEWYKQLKEFNKKQPKEYIEVVRELDENGNIHYVVYNNGVCDKKRTKEINDALKESWLDKSFNAIEKFLDIVGSVLQTATGISTIVTGVIGIFGGCAVVTLSTGGVGILVDGIIVTKGIVLTATGIAITVEGVNSLTANGFASNNGGNYKTNFPKSSKEFKDTFGTNKNGFHRDIKPEIQKDLNADPKLRKWLSQFGTNPDIGVDSLGNIVLRATVGKPPFKELITNLKLEWYLFP